MSNNLLTISKITNEALMVLENELTFTGQVDRNYDDQFSVVGAKIGQTVNVRRPGRFLGAIGPNLVVEDFNETSVPVTLSTQFQVSTQFTTQDLALSLDMFSDRILKPAIATVANKMDRDGLVTAKNNTANIVGTAGTAPTGLITYLTAAAYLDSEGAPRDGRRSCTIEPFTSSTIVDSLKGLFVPTSQISSQYTKGLMGRDSGGMNWYMDQNVVSQTFGSYASATLSCNVTTATGFLTSGWAYSSNITIGATGFTGDRSYYSNYSGYSNTQGFYIGVDISAPGGDDRVGLNKPAGGLIWSTTNDGKTGPGRATYGAEQGTSMASPIAAGVVALMYSIRPSLTYTQVWEILSSTARSFNPNSDCEYQIIETTMNDGSTLTTGECGIGIIDADAAVRAVQELNK
jgi:subtilisin family serine protease